MSEKRYVVLEVDERGSLKSFSGMHYNAEQFGNGDILTAEGVLGTVLKLPELKGRLHTQIGWGAEAMVFNFIKGRFEVARCQSIMHPCLILDPEPPVEAGSKYDTWCELMANTIVAVIGEEDYEGRDKLMRMLKAMPRPDLRHPQMYPTNQGRESTE